MRRSYIINVCRTCGAHAVYPFVCGHRPETYTPTTPPWTIAITVEATTSSQTILDRLGVSAS